MRRRMTYSENERKFYSALFDTYAGLIYFEVLRRQISNRLLLFYITTILQLNILYHSRRHIDSFRYLERVESRRRRFHVDSNFNHRLRCRFSPKKEFNSIQKRNTKLSNDHFLLYLSIPSDKFDIK